MFQNQVYRYESQKGNVYFFLFGFIPLYRQLGIELFHGVVIDPVIIIK